MAKAMLEEAKKKALQEVIKKMRLVEAKDPDKEEKKEKVPSGLAEGGEGAESSAEGFEPSGNASSPKEASKKDEVPKELDEDFEDSKRKFMKKNGRNPQIGEQSKTFASSFAKKIEAQVKKPGRPKGN